MFQKQSEKPLNPVWLVGTRPNGWNGMEELYLPRRHHGSSSSFSSGPQRRHENLSEPAAVCRLNKTDPID